MPRKMPQDICWVQQSGSHGAQAWKIFMSWTIVDKPEQLRVPST